MKDIEKWEKFKELVWKKIAEKYNFGEKEKESHNLLIISVIEPSSDNVEEMVGKYTRLISNMRHYLTTEEMQELQKDVFGGVIY